MAEIHAFCYHRGMARKYSIHFTGRKRGALGIFYRIRATREAEDPARAVLALYDEYEHISNPVVTDAKTGETTRPRNHATKKTKKTKKMKATGHATQKSAEQAELDELLRIDAEIDEAMRTRPRSTKKPPKKKKGLLARLFGL
jgi:hypothetical protein